MSRIPSSFTRRAPRPLLLAGGALLLGLAAGAQAQPVAKSSVSITLHAGPATAYPQVRQLPVNSAFEIHGCLADFGWCDVGSGRFRGWVDASHLSVSVGGRVGPVVQFGAQIGVPVVNFAIGPYWTTHYRNQPWFDDPYYAPAIESYRMRSRNGDTVIEVERTWHARPQYAPPAIIHHPPAVHVVPPPVIHYPPPVYHRPPPGRVRPYGAEVFPPSRAPDWARGYGPTHIYPPSGRPGWVYNSPPPDRVRPYSPPPQYHPPQYHRPPQPLHQPDFNNLPGYQPGSRPMPPGAIHGPGMHEGTGGGLGTRMLK